MRRLTPNYHSLSTITGMKEEKIKAEFGNFPPETTCRSCDGRGEIKDDYITRFFGSGNWTYKKCQHCNGTGKNLWHCLTCDELIGIEFWCANQNCKMYNIKVGLARKRE